MVGRKTSARCENCRKRKIKCDLLKPACSPCLKSGLQCPGYDTHARFLVVDPQRAVAKQRISHIKSELLSETDVLRNDYVYKLTNGQLTVRFWMTSGQREGNLTTLSFIPRRLGESTALDDAVRCICSAPSSQCGDDATTKSYLKALGSLQNALNDSIESMTSGTLTATMLLYMYEIYSNPFQQSWMVHADGLIRLLEVRGPDRIVTELDKSILCRQVGTIFLSAVQQRKPCFLADPRWNNLLQQLSASSLGTSGDLDESPSIMSLSVHLPGLLCNYERLSAIAEPTTTLGLMKDISRLQLQLRRWRSSKDILMSEPEYEIEYADAYRDPLNCAFRLSAVMFLILSAYIYVDLLNRTCATTSNIGEGGLDTLHAKGVDSVVESSELAIIASIRWEAVKNVDVVAAWACGTPNIMMFGRALSVPCTDSPEVRSMRQILEDLHKRLSEDDR